MSCQIYIIEDCNQLKYVGSTTCSLKTRLINHKSDKKVGKYCSSCQLDLDNCEIKLLEECDISHRKQRESYWINHIDCVNIIKLNFDQKEYERKWYVENKEKQKQKQKEYYEQNKEKVNRLNNKHHNYKKSWGGDTRYYNNLLRIDEKLFLN